MFEGSEPSAGHWRDHDPSAARPSTAQARRVLRRDPHSGAGRAGRDHRRVAALAAADAPRLGQQRPDLRDTGLAWPETEKKMLHATEQDRADIAAARREWRDNQPTLDPARLVFIDESVLQRNGRSSAWTRTVREAAGKMGAGPPGSAFRSGSQTSPSCCGKEPWW